LARQRKAGFDPAGSDLDFIVEFGEAGAGPWASGLIALRDDLEGVFGRRVDLVTLRAVCEHPRFRDVDATKVPVYAAA
jgi:uncharacterized protein